MRPSRHWTRALLVALVASAALAGTTPPDPAAARPTALVASEPLSGLVIALDPGHQLGNRHFRRRIARLVPAGGFRKACDTPGTTTAAGYPEATENFLLAQAVAVRLEGLGATVRMTRTTNSDGVWGPCVSWRGHFGRRVGAALTVSLHADGAYPTSLHGFLVISPIKRYPWTTDIADASRQLAVDLRNALDAGGIPRSTYLGGGTGLMQRRDLATQNLSDVPVAMIEVGNMKNPQDAARMTSDSGRTTYADAVVRGIRAYLHRCPGPNSRPATRDPAQIHACSVNLRRLSEGWA